MQNGRILGQRPPGGDEGDLGRRALGVKIGRFEINFKYKTVGFGARGHQEVMRGGLWLPFGALGTSGACFAVRRVVGFQRSRESEHIAAEGHQFLVLTFLWDFRNFRKMAASPAKASVSPQRGDVIHRSHDF